jgi:nucleotide-binding universal stress UspA family protein
MARQHGDELVFLYVVDLDFLNKTERAVRPDVVAEEMRHLGEFLLSMAQERARDQGVDAQYILREGDVATEIKAAAVEEGATVVVLGHAAPDDPTRAFAPEGLLRFAQEIENETGIEARVVR